ncbi:MAG: radical SAM protein [Chitinivibrionales bacterium]|nr:radical SAM protein [Chitinivibrionales bacterium]MBD3394832.1 radical SAM protein [Chitinivibrionales bacterium]
MKVTFIYPRFEKFLSALDELHVDRGLVEYFLGDFTTPPSLGIPIMASWTPPDVERELIDDNAGDPIDFDAPTDLVAINCFTPQATRAFEIADGYRARGKKVIMGGFFPSFMVDECLKHADAVNLGEVEPTWERILEDARRGELKKKYIGGNRFDVSKMRIPDRSMFYNKENYDWDEDLVQITRGCSYTCAMCSIPAHMGSRIRLRPIDKVIEEIRTLKFENVYLADDTLFFPQRRIAEYAAELFKRLEPLGKKYFVASTMALRWDKEFLDLAARAGICNFYCTMNVDPISIKALQGGARERQMLVDLVRMLEDRNIRFFGSFAIGRDWDDTGIADRILDLYIKAGIRTSEFFFFTPYPGSVHWERLERQGRIFDKDWRNYNGAHVVAEHPAMSVDQLREQFTKVWTEFFRLQKERHASHLEPLTYDKGQEIVGKPLQRKGVRGQAVVTGIGVLSPIGNDPATITASLQDGRTGIAPITKFDTSHFRTPFGGEIRGFNPADHLGPEEIRQYEDPYLQRAVTTARQALAHAGIQIHDGGVRRDIALVLGTCNGGLLSAEAEYSWKHGKTVKSFDEHMNLQAQYYGFGKALAHALGIGGEVWLVTTACSSTTGAIGLAQMLINRGYYDKVVLGGSDALCVANMSGFNGLKATSTDRVAPFSLPVGLNVGEACVFWVVEEMEKAMVRKAHCLARLAGHATTCDAYHPTAPDPRGDGVYRTLECALADAQLSVADIGCINSHGTGTEANDRAESKGIARLIGDTPVPVISLKSFFGHCMGSTGLLEATCGVLAMNEGFVPPTINFTEPRPGCTLDYVPNESRQARYDAFVSANYAFGGNNAAAVITKWDLPAIPRALERKRVVITGAGAVSSLGIGCNTHLAALRNGETGIGGIDPLQLEGMSSDRAGMVPEFRGADVDRRIDFDAMNRISRFAAAAAVGALAHAGLKVNRRNATDFGMAMGVCNGPPETEHMDSVFSSDTFEPNINSFSNIVANSTAGWVANALCLKGVNTTLAPGPHAGLQCMAYALEFLAGGRAKCILAAAADEIYPQTYYNYNLMGFLYQGNEEIDYRLRLSESKRKVIGEGAAALAMETLDAAAERKARILGEVLGYGMSADAGPFDAQCLGTEGLAHACERALERARVNAESIDLIVWAPQGNAQDQKVLSVVEQMVGRRDGAVPLVTTTFNTGYIESASILVSLGAVLAALEDGAGLWPQKTGVPGLDQRDFPPHPRHILALASTDVGYNFAVVLRSGPVSTESMPQIQGAGQVAGYAA